MIRDNREQGGIVSFAVVGLVLAGLLLGGLYMSKQQGKIAADNATPEPVVQHSTTASKPADTPPAPEPTKKPEAAKPDTSVAAPNTPASPNTLAPTSQPSVTAAAPSVARTGPSTVVSAGPTEAVAAIFVLAGLGFACTWFVQTRRAFIRASLHRS